MSQPKFFYFKDLQYKSQPYNSNWCWAACLSSMINGLGASSKVGGKQCSLVSFYREYKRNKDCTRSTYTSCCNKAKTIDHKCNIGLEPDDIEDIFWSCGFEIKREHDLSKIYDYDWVKHQLINNKAPFLLEITMDGYAHANLVTGFGELGDCKYLLITDPIKTTGESYTLMDKLPIQLTIKKIWVTELIIDENLTKDEEIIERFNKAKSFIGKIKTEDDELKNPNNYLGFHNPQIIDEIMEGNTVNPNTLNKLSVDFRAQKQKADSCQPNIRKKPTENRDILAIDFEDLTKPTDDTITLLKDNILKTYVDDYGIELMVIMDMDRLREMQLAITTDWMRSVNSGESTSSMSMGYNNDYPILVKPTRFPTDHNLEREFQSLESFKATLESLNKVSFFKYEQKTLTA